MELTGNAAIMSRAIDAFNSRDWEAFAASMSPDVLVESRLVAVEGGYRGHAGLRRWWDDLIEMLPDYRLEALGFEEDGELLICHMRGRAHGALSSAPVVDPNWIASRWRDGVCHWWRVCRTEAEARKAIASHR